MRRERLERAWGPHTRRCLTSRPAVGTFRGLVLVLHGAGATSAWMFQETDLEDWAGEHGLMLAFPEATRQQMDKPPHVLDNTPCWEDGGLRRHPKPREGADDLVWLDALVAELNPTGALPTVVAGFSNGASMALRLAAEGRSPLAGVLAIGGFPRAALAGPARAIPTVFVHGEADPIVPPAGGWVKTPWQSEGYAIAPMSEVVTAWSRAMGAEVEREGHGQPFIRRRHFYQSVASAKPLTRWLCVAGLGHHWPGGKGQWESPSMGPRLDGVLDTRTLLLELLDNGQVC